MSINTVNNTNEIETQSLQTLIGKKKSKYKYVLYPVRPKTSARKVGNNIQEKLFQAKLYAYEVKQKEMIMDAREMIKIYQKCELLSKKITLPKNQIYLEDIEHVVARIVDEVFGLRVVSEQKKINTSIRRLNSVQEFKERPEDSAPFRAGDFKVWDGQSQQHVDVLESIAGKLLALHSRWWAETRKLAMEKKRLCHWMDSITTPNRQIADELSQLCVDRSTDQQRLTDDLNRQDFMDIMTIVRDSLLEMSRECEAAKKRPSMVKVLERKNSRRNGNGNLKCKLASSCCHPSSQQTSAMIHELRRLRKDLALVNDKLKVTTKEKRDLLMTIQHGNLSKTIASGIQSKLDKEIEKNIHLQSVVDEMFIAMETSRPNIRTKNNRY